MVFFILQNTECGAVNVIFTELKMVFCSSSVGFVGGDIRSIVWLEVSSCNNSLLRAQRQSLMYCRWALELHFFIPPGDRVRYGREIRSLHSSPWPQLAHGPFHAGLPLALDGLPVLFFLLYFCRRHSFDYSS